MRPSAPWRAPCVDGDTDLDILTTEENAGGNDQGFGSLYYADGCDPAAGFVLTSITSNEADDGEDDGSTVGDIRGAEYGTPDTSFQLRAERSGLGNGRVYTIRYSAHDGSGNTAETILEVRVPLNKGG